MKVSNININNESMFKACLAKNGFSGCDQRTGFTTAVISEYWLSQDDHTQNLINDLESEGFIVTKE